MERLGMLGCGVGLFFVFYSYRPSRRQQPASLRGLWLSTVIVLNSNITNFMAMFLCYRQLLLNFLYYLKTLYVTLKVFKILDIFIKAKPTGRAVTAKLYA